MEGDLLHPYLVPMVELGHDGRTLDPFAPQPFLPPIWLAPTSARVTRQAGR